MKYEPVYHCGDHEYLVETIIHESRDLPIKWCLTSNLDHRLDIAFWWERPCGQGVRITPRSVLQTQKPEWHWQRIEEADLQYPILFHNGHLVDGMHRLAKAVRDGHEKIPWRDLTNEIMKISRDT